MSDSKKGWHDDGRSGQGRAARRNDSNPIDTSSFFGTSSGQSSSRKTIPVSSSALSGNPSSRDGATVTMMEVDESGPSSRHVQAIDLDADDTIPPDSPPPIEGGLEYTTDARAPVTILDSAGFPDVHTADLAGHGYGHGYFVNALLGKSQVPAFKLGHALGWMDNVDAAGMALEDVLYDFDVKEDFVAQQRSAASTSSTPSTQQKPSSSVSASASTPTASPAKSAPSWSSIVAGPSSPSSQQSAKPASSASYYPLKPDQLRAAKPHPNAFYNVRTHTWLVAASWPPDSTGTERAHTNCYQKPKPHHYVPLKRLVDPRFILRQTECPSRTFDASPLATTSHSLGGPASAPFPLPASTDDVSWAMQQTPKDAWWDLFVCSQCRRGFTVSGVGQIPSILGRDLCENFEKARGTELKDASIDQREKAMKDAIDYVWKVLRNLLYAGERSGIPTSGATYTKRMGTSQVAVDLFFALGFKRRAGPADAPHKVTLEPPQITPNTLLLLTRAFLELSIWAAHLFGPQAASLTNQNASHLITLKSPVEALERITQPDTMARISVSALSAWKGAKVPDNYYQMLGVVPETGDEGIILAYRLQKTDTVHGPWYMEALKEIAIMRGQEGSELGELVAIEESAGTYPISTVKEAFTNVGYPLHESSEMFFGFPMVVSPDEDALSSAFMDRKENIGTGQGTDGDLKKLKDALKLVAQIMESELLKALVDSLDPSKPEAPRYTAEEAYKHFDMVSTTETSTLLTAVDFYLNEDAQTQFQKDKHVSALSAIADARNDEAIRTYIKTRQLPSMRPQSPEEAPVSADRPAGLQNIGNTCYLNSLLQYFFTIRELREVILSYERFREDEPTEEVLSSKRVGGRHVTRREIERSKKFVAHLSTLFAQLVHSQSASVRPEHDLAYLALVSTKDEDEATSPTLPSIEEEKSETAATTSLGLDATMTSEPEAMPTIDAASEGLAAAQISTISEPAADGAGSPSVLGKRDGSHLEDMDVDRQTGSPSGPGSLNNKDDDRDFVMVSAQEIQGAIDADKTQPSRTDSATSPSARAADTDAQSDAQPSQEAPPLPPRPEQRKKSTSIVNTNMMFGRQNDVSEAMDNVIFQIEVGLSDQKIKEALQLQTASDRSFVQSLFYGTTRQSLTFDSAANESPRIKDQPFSYLLVDVAQEGKDLYEGLDDAFATSAVEIEGQKVVRQDVLTELPPILQIQLQRVQFDRNTARVFKSNAYMPFPLTLKMNRYMAYDPQDTTTADKHRRSDELKRQITQARARLTELERLPEDKQTISDLYREVADSLQQLLNMPPTNEREGAFSAQLSDVINEGSTNLSQTLQEHAGLLEQDITNTKQALDTCRTQLAQVWQDLEDADYELSSVFIHLGAAGYGHYYLYQRALPSQPDRWLKYNDATVTDVDVSDIFANTTGSTANPYWLTYVRKQEVVRRIDAVCRQF